MNCLTDLDTDRLVEKAQWVRLQVLERVAAAGMGHLGGTFSCVDILVVLYYGGILRFDAALPDWTNRDRLVVGKGHACLALYAIWAGFLAGKSILYAKNQFRTSRVFQVCISIKFRC